MYIFIVVLYPTLQFSIIFDCVYFDNALMINTFLILRFDMVDNKQEYFSGKSLNGNAIKIVHIQR